MSAGVELKNWEKFSILSWKNLYVTLKNYRVVLNVVFIPPAFCIVLVILRLLTEMKFQATRVYRPMDTNRSWSSLLEEIEARRMKIRETKQDFEHSADVPQPVLAFAPDFETQIVDMQNAVERDIRGVGLRGFKSCDELKAAMQIEHFFAGVCVLHEDEVLFNSEIKIVFPSELRIYNDSFIGANWNTNDIYDLHNSYDERQMSRHDGGYVGYVREGFAAIQNAVVMAYIRRVTGKNFPTPKVQRYPSHARYHDLLTESIKISISFVLVCGFMYPVLTLTYRDVKEKKKNVKKIMNVMGVQNWIQISAWFAKYFILMLVSSIVIVILLKIRWIEKRSILPNSSAMVLQLCLFAYITAAISFVLMMSAFFSDSRAAVCVTGIIWICSYLPYIASTYKNSLSHLQPLLFCFCNNILAFLFEEIIALEKFSDGLQWSSLTKSASIHQSRSAAFYILMLFVLSIVYILVAVYVENFTFNYNIFSKKVTSIFRDEDRPPRTSRRNIGYRQTVVHEIQHSYKNVVMKIQNLCKIFKGVYAVKNLNMTVHEGDITVLMGHNGSGKTILLQMIAGMLNPTSGKIEIQGLDANKHKYFARRNLGISLNSDLPFPELDVIDQLIFFARLRGLVTPELENEVQKYLDVMQLNYRKYCAAQKLSKGEQRFLSVCCALIGGCKIILLDEPSMGLDLLAKESLWELLRSESKTRSIILTTHCEEESEALADQIGVFSCGELKCFGSSFFLKKVYGQGHRLICYKGQEFHKEKLLNLIQRHIPLATIESEIANQISFILGDVKSFVDLFDDLENNAEEIGVSGISVAEMNSADIFFKLGAHNPTDENRQRHSNEDPSQRRETYVPELDGGEEKVTGCRLFMNQCQSLIFKRVLASFRNIPLSLVRLTMPILFTVMSFSLLSHDRQRETLKDISFKLQQYPDSITFYHISPASAETDDIKMLESYEEELFWTGVSHQAKRVPNNTPGFIRHVLDVQKGLNEFEINKYLVGIDIKDESITAFFNNYPLHTVPLSLNLVHNSMLRGFSNYAKINVVSSPLPFSSSHNLNVKSLPVSIGNYLAVNISFCASFIWSLTVIFLVRERKSHFKFFQYIFGVRGFVFWFNAFIWDVILIFITSLIILVSIMFFELHIFMKEETSASYFFVLIAAGICMCSANYLASVTWRDPHAAYIAITTFNAVGTMSFWAYTEVFKRGFKDHPNKYLFESMMRVFPHFSFCKALVKSFYLGELKTICKDKEVEYHFDNLGECDIIPKCCDSLFAWKFDGGVFSDLTYVLIYGIVCWILLCIVENYNEWTKRLGYGTLNSEPEYNFPESDFESVEANKLNDTMNKITAREEQKVFDIDPVTSREKVLVCNRLCTLDGVQFVLNQVTFAVNRGECFTILGKNASGKTTLIKALIDRIPINFGKVHIDGLNLQTDINSIYQRIGYCSQEEIFLAEFKLLELMRMACLLRGIPNRKVMDIVDYLSSVLGFYMNLKNRYETCSSGIRKRFYCACAFIGNPQIIFIDCASSNLDLLGRRQLWSVVFQSRAKGQSFVLTTTGTKHYQKVTDRLLVLSYGRHMLLSDPLSVCEKGYILKVKVRKITIILPGSNETLITPKYSTVSANTFLKLANFIENEFPLFQIKGQLGNTIEYFIPAGSTSLSHIYRLMQRNSFNLYVEDFSITSLTLSTIFMEILKQQQRSSK